MVRRDVRVLEPGLGGQVRQDAERPEVATDYVAAACDKLQTDRVGFSDDGVRALLLRLAATGDVEGELIAKLRSEVSADSQAG